MRGASEYTAITARGLRGRPDAFTTPRAARGLAGSHATLTDGHARALSLRAERAESCKDAGLAGSCSPGPNGVAATMRGAHPPHKLARPTPGHSACSLARCSAYWSVQARTVKRPPRYAAASRLASCQAGHAAPRALSRVSRSKRRMLLPPSQARQRAAHAACSVASCSHRSPQRCRARSPCSGRRQGDAGASDCSRERPRLSDPCRHAPPPSQPRSFPLRSPRCLHLRRPRRFPFPLRQRRTRRTSTRAR